MTYNEILTNANIAINNMVLEYVETNNVNNYEHEHIVNYVDRLDRLAWDLNNLVNMIDNERLAIAVADTVDLIGALRVAVNNGALSTAEAEYIRYEE